MANILGEIINSIKAKSSHFILLLPQYLFTLMIKYIYIHNVYIYT
jgi:hypothetical protein